MLLVVYCIDKGQKKNEKIAYVQMRQLLRETVLAYLGSTGKGTIPQYFGLKLKFRQTFKYGINSLT